MLPGSSFPEFVCSQPVMFFSGTRPCFACKTLNMRTVGIVVVLPPTTVGLRSGAISL